MFLPTQETLAQDSESRGGGGGVALNMSLSFCSTVDIIITERD